MENHRLVPSSNDDDQNALLLYQQRQLSILNAIIQTVSSTRNLKETLETALEIILEEIGSQVGWVCLLGEADTCFAFVGHKGLCFDHMGHATAPCLVRCVCSRVRKTRDVVVISPLAQGCPLLETTEDSSQPVIGHVSVPLTTQSRIVGQLNVAFGDQKMADQMDIQLLKSVGPPLAVAVENARLWDEVQEKEERRRELLKKVVSAQEEERRRISRDLHDELGQELTSMLVRLQLLEKPGGENHADEVIEGIKESVTQMVTFLHDLALELRPTSLDDLGLVSALAQYTRLCPETLGIQVDFEAVGFNNERLPREVETTIYRVIQESLTNVARHSGVHQASVMLKKDDSAIIVVVEDNGVGFNPKEQQFVQASKHRLGLYGIEERVSIVGGTLTVESTVGVGTTIHIKIPLAGSDLEHPTAKD